MQETYCENVIFLAADSWFKNSCEKETKTISELDTYFELFHTIPEIFSISSKTINSYFEQKSTHKHEVGSHIHTQ